MSILDAFKVNKIKAELEQTQRERDSLKAILSETERMDVYELKKAIADLEERKNVVIREMQGIEADIAKKRQALEQQLNEVGAQLVKKRQAMEQQLNEESVQIAKRRQALEQQLRDLDAQIAARKNEIIVLDDEILLQSFGFYKPRYDLQNSELYKAKLEQIRAQQAALVKAGRAAYGTVAWKVNNSEKEGAQVIKDYVKLILRSFNNECDASIINVKFSNLAAIEKKIQKAFETLNTLGKRMNIVIAPEYLNLKLQELYLCYEYQVKKQEEKEEQRRLREQMKEEAKLLKEIEDMKLKAEKEEKHFSKALETLDLQLQKAKTDAERQALEEERATIQQKLAEVEKSKQDIAYWEQNTRAGYVYVISNIGSFGENVYKIGVTRRLEPQERIDELGDASVPFGFDIHALIFSDDAPALETALHKAFESRRMNMINRRREFFKVTLDEVEEMVKAHFNKPVEFTRLADAAEYRQSLALRGDSN